MFILKNVYFTLIALQVLIFFPANMGFTGHIAYLVQAISEPSASFIQKKKNGITNKCIAMWVALETSHQPSRH